MKNYSVQLVIDDVGWLTGDNESQNNKPYRSGHSRNHCLADYQAIAELGRRLSIRPVIAMVIGDWDRKNVLRNVPGATWMGSEWDNSQNIKMFEDELEKIVDFLNKNQDYFEIAVHGLQHEYWQAGQMSRAEFYDRNGNMRPAAHVKAHLDAFFEIMEHNGLKVDMRTFVPPAFNYACSEEGGGMSKLLKSYGFKYVATRFAIMKNAPKSRYHEEEGLQFVDRDFDEHDWYESDVFPVKEIDRPTYGLHWPNVLSADAGNNLKVVDKWVSFFEEKVRAGCFTLAKDLEDCAEKLRVKVM